MENVPLNESHAEKWVTVVYYEETNAKANHHFQEKSKGRNDRNSNLVMLHLNCHRQIHSSQIQLVKPAFACRGLKRLEPDDGKLSRPVLRGGSSW